MPTVLAIRRCHCAVLCVWVSIIVAHNTDVTLMLLSAVLVVLTGLVKGSASCWNNSAAAVLGSSSSSRREKYISMVGVAFSSWSSIV